MNKAFEDNIPAFTYRVLPSQNGLPRIKANSSSLSPCHNGLCEGRPRFAKLPPSQDPQIWTLFDHYELATLISSFVVNAFKIKLGFWTFAVSPTSFLNRRNLHTENKKDDKSGSRAKSKAVAVGCSLSGQPGKQAGWELAARRTGIIRVDIFFLWSKSKNIFFSI